MCYISSAKSSILEFFLAWELNHHEKKKRIRFSNIHSDWATSTQTEQHPLRLSNIHSDWATSSQTEHRALRPSNMHSANRCEALILYCLRCAVFITLTSQLVRLLWAEPRSHSSDKQQMIIIQFTVVGQWGCNDHTSTILISRSPRHCYHWNSSEGHTFFQKLYDKNIVIDHLGQIHVPLSLPCVVVKFSMTWGANPACTLYIVVYT